MTNIAEIAARAAAMMPIHQREILRLASRWDPGPEPRDDDKEQACGKAQPCVGLKAVLQERTLQAAGDRNRAVVRG